MLASNPASILNRIFDRAGIVKTRVRVRKSRSKAGIGQRLYRWVFVGLIQAAKLNGVETQAWCIDVLERIISGRTKRHQLDNGPRSEQISDTA
jgi:hypothetical protein